MIADSNYGIAFVVALCSDIKSIFSDIRLQIIHDLDSDLDAMKAPYFISSIHNHREVLRPMLYLKVPVNGPRIPRRSSRP